MTPEGTVSPVPGGPGEVEGEGPDLSLINLADIEELESYVATTTVTWVAGGAEDPMSIDPEGATVLVIEKRVVDGDEALGGLNLDVDALDRLQYAYVVAAEGADLGAASGTDAAEGAMGSETLMPAEFVTVDGTTYARTGDGEWLQLVGSMASYVADTLDMQGMDALYERLDLGDVLDDFWWEQGEILGDDLTACMPADGEAHTVPGAEDLMATQYTCEYAEGDLGGRWDNFDTVTSDIWVVEDYQEEMDLVVRRLVVGEANEEFTAGTDMEGETGTVVIESVLSQIGATADMVIPQDVLDEVGMIEGLEIMGDGAVAAPGTTTTPETTTTPGAADGAGASVTVEDQPVGEGNTVVIASVVADQPGWIVVHADDNGAPGPDIGWAPVEEGENTDVEVVLDQGDITETLYAMLHIDVGAEGTYEFPGPDAPARGADGSVVTVPFTVELPE